MRILLCALILALAASILWGIGSAFRRLIGSPKGRWPVTIGIGLSALVFLGGILNLLHMAYRPVLWIVILLGLIIAVLELLRSGISIRRALPQDTASRVELSLVALVIAAVMLFTIATQLPPAEFNFHDDLQKYFAHPVRMLETGTLAGSPLSALGSETLGGQAFLHALVLSFAAISYINGVDAVFGLLLLMLLAGAAGWRRFAAFPGAALGVLLVALINPQYVNVSGLYLGAALMATAILLVADEHEASPPSAMALGTVYAAMVALKPTFAVFAGLHWLFALLAVRAEAQSWKPFLRRAAFTVAGAAISIAPWIMVHAPNYFAHGGADGAAVPNGMDLAGANLFSTERLYDGDSVASYTALAALSLFVAIVALVAWWQGREAGATAQVAPSAAGRPLGLFAGAAAGIGCFLVVIFYLGIYAGYQQSIRYVTPFALGACTIPALLAPSLVPRIPRAAGTLIPAIAVLAISASFVPAAVDRYHQAEQFGSILAFPPLAESPEYLPYIQYSLSTQARDQVRKYQDKVPPGEPILAWINAPFWLDYRRNPIIDVDTAGIASPWAHIPSGVHYFLWQYQGYAVRTPNDYRDRMHVPGARERLIAQESLHFADHITDLANTSPIVANDDQFVLFRVNSPK